MFEKLSLAYTITSRPKSFSRDGLFAKSHGVIHETQPLRIPEDGDQRFQTIVIAIPG